MRLMKLANRKAVAGIIADILADKKYMSKEETALNQCRLGNFLVFG